jgi:hypothetical protein
VMRCHIPFEELRLLQRRAHAADGLAVGGGAVEAEGVAP